MRPSVPWRGDSRGSVRCRAIAMQTRPHRWPVPTARVHQVFDARDLYTDICPSNQIHPSRYPGHVAETDGAFTRLVNDSAFWYTPSRRLITALAHLHWSPW